MFLICSFILLYVCMWSYPGLIQFAGFLPLFCYRAFRFSFTNYSEMFLTFLFWMVISPTYYSFYNVYFIFLLPKYFFLGSFKIWWFLTCLHSSVPFPETIIEPSIKMRGLILKHFLWNLSACFLEEFMLYISHCINIGCFCPILSYWDWVRPLSYRYNLSMISQQFMSLAGINCLSSSSLGLYA